jgi:hypothetical protein
MNSLGRTALLVVPALLLAACGDPTSGSSAQDPTNAAETPAPDWPVGLSFTGLQQGAGPAMAYLRRDPDAPGGWSVVEQDGDVRPLSRSYAQFAPMGAGLVGLAYEDDTTVAYLLDGDLSEVSRTPAGEGGLAVTPDGSIVGWLGADKAPHFVEDGGDRAGSLPVVEGGASLAALLVDGTTCQEGEGGNGCAAFVNSADSSKVWSSVSHGIVEAVPGVLYLGDVADDGGMLAMTSIADEGSCWGLFTVWKREPKWETCDYTLFDFSPSGDRILAGPAYLDGFGHGIAAVLDRQGNVIAEWHSNGDAAILGTTWEDEDHVLVTAYQHERLAVIRVGLDGSAEFALPPVPDPGAGGAYVLPVR